MLKEQIRQVQGLFYPPYRKQSLTTNLFSLDIVDAYDIPMMIISSYWKKTSMTYYAKHCDDICCRGLRHAAAPNQ